jgi:hypothetical protein
MRTRTRTVLHICDAFVSADASATYNVEVTPNGRCFVAEHDADADLAAALSGENSAGETADLRELEDDFRGWLSAPADCASLG